MTSEDLKRLLKLKINYFRVVKNSKKRSYSRETRHTQAKTYKITGAIRI